MKPQWVMITEILITHPSILPTPLISSFWQSVNPQYTAKLHRTSAETIYTNNICVTYTTNSLWPWGAMWWDRTGSHWFRQWLDACWHQAITCTNVNLSTVQSKDIHLHKRYLRHQSLNLSGKWPIKNFVKISQGRMSCNCHWPLLLTWFNFNPSMDK